ncbi:MAG: YhbY family RNA-binding protein [Candidatus Woesearchaeota archaeon]
MSSNKDSKKNKNNKKNAWKKQSQKSKIQIGKKGITQSLIEEIIRQVKTHKIVEIKLLRSFRQEIGRKELIKMIEELAMKTNSKIISFKGFTLLIAAKNKKQ